jgi:VanZ family protein
MTIILRIFAWLLAAAVAFATLGPPGYRPHSDLGQNGEHALAFVLIGLAFGLAYTQRRLLTAAIAVAMIGLIEILQFWAPGRHARLSDFIVDALAACAGFAVAAGVGWVAGQSRQPKRQNAIPAGTVRPREE